MPPTYRVAGLSDGRRRTGCCSRRTGCCSCRTGCCSCRAAVFVAIGTHPRHTPPRGSAKENDRRQTRSASLHLFPEPLSRSPPFLTKASSLCRIVAPPCRDWFSVSGSGMTLERPHLIVIPQTLPDVGNTARGENQEEDDRHAREDDTQSSSRLRVHDVGQEGA